MRKLILPAVLVAALVSASIAVGRRWLRPRRVQPDCSRGHVLGDADEDVDADVHDERQPHDRRHRRHLHRHRHR